MAGPAYARTESAFELLVVSPDNQAHDHLHGILNRDCDLYRASGRQEALSLLRKNRPTVVICDEVLPDGDWRDLLKDMHREPDAPPLIVLSRLADDRLWAEVLNLGGYDLLEKPLTATEVSRVVQMAARRGSKAAG